LTGWGDKIEVLVKTRVLPVAAKIASTDPMIKYFFRPVPGLTTVDAVLAEKCGEWTVGTVEPGRLKDD
jgi:hypothetical protein